MTSFTFIPLQLIFQIIFLSKKCRGARLRVLIITQNCGKQGRFVHLSYSAYICLDKAGILPFQASSQSYYSMKRFLFIAFLLCLVYAAITNPGKEEFISYLAHEQIEKTDNILGKSIINALKKYADEIIAKEKGEIEDLVIRKNYYLFSKYEVDLPVIDQHVTYIGALNTFTKLPSKE